MTQAFFSRQSSNAEWAIASKTGSADINYDRIAVPINVFDQDLEDEISDRLFAGKLSSIIGSTAPLKSGAWLNALVNLEDESAFTVSPIFVPTRRASRDAGLLAKVKAVYENAPVEAQTEYVWDVLMIGLAVPNVLPYVKMRGSDVAVDFKLPNGLVSLLIDDEFSYISSFLPYSEMSGTFAITEDSGVLQSLRVLKSLMPSGE